MCGIVGLYSHGRSSEELKATCVTMTTRLSHRGPDDSGQWAHTGLPLVFGHRRLSILDLSSLGHQPMHSRSERFTIVFNGEIYNYRELQNDLIKCGYSFRGHSDTEVLLAAFEQWGIEETLKRTNGMFAIALWDNETRELTITRDRIGIKPLYYGWYNNSFGFASELTAFFGDKRFPKDISRSATALFFRYNYVPVPYSIFSSHYKLPPGTFLTLPLSSLEHKPDDFSPFAMTSACSPKKYWDLSSHAASQTRKPLLAYEDSKRELTSLLTSSVSYRMLSDVPVGAFLSGGIDSSLVVACMQQVSTHPVRTFSIGFSESSFDEAPYAKEIASHLKTEHTELYVSPRDALDLVPTLAEPYSEPFSDSSQIPTLLLSKLTREHVTVALSGDGGDELFGGYERYLLASQIETWFNRIPYQLRSLATVLPTSLASLGYSLLRPLLPKRFQSLKTGDMFSRGAHMLSRRTPAEMYSALITHWHESSSLVLGAQEIEDDPFFITSFPEFQAQFERFAYIDMHTYLPEDILTKVDRASMAYSLEARTPLLDHRIIEYSWSLPPQWKIQHHDQKCILKDILTQFVPKELFDRPKMGFGVPLASWLRHELQEWAESLLSTNSLESSGLDANRIQHLWKEHLQGTDWHYQLWDVVMYQQWKESLSRPS
ncbi:MAG: asparagine synthase (glutamine-hydrolyzing) [Bdellovibrionales bacterium]|nr:asparagine synthase (glutamine-hydrolyzing) [Bdellovibrionales bacterium]